MYLSYLFNLAFLRLGKRLSSAIIDGANDEPKELLDIILDLFMLALFVAKVPPKELLVREGLRLSPFPLPGLGLFKFDAKLLLRLLPGNWLPPLEYLSLSPSIDFKFEALAVLLPDDNDEMRPCDETKELVVANLFKAIVLPNGGRAIFLFLLHLVHIHSIRVSNSFLVTVGL